MEKVSKQSTTGDMPVVSSSSSQDRETPRFTRRETLLTMAGVLLVMLLASLDQTIVGTAMPRIITDLQGFDRYTWVTTAYLLTSTVMVHIYGKLSDIFGRKPLFLIGVTLFLVGSAASGAAQSMNQLIAFRAFQGLGAAALMPIAIAVIGDLFTPRERGKWQGLTGAVFGLSSILGPTAGGWITDHSTWRWVFYVNLPIGIIALLVLIFLMPTLRTQKAGKVSVDYVGAMLLIVATVPLLLGFTWAGSQYDWASWQIISLFAGSIVFIALLVLYEARLERLNAQPIIDPSMFKNRIFSVSVLVTMITSMGMFGSILFLPLYVPGLHHAIPAQIKAAVPAQVISIFDNANVLLSSDVQKQLMAQFAKYGPQGHVLYNQLMEAVKVGLTSGIHNVYVLSTILMVIGFFFIFFLKEIPLRGGKRSVARRQAPEDAAEGTVVMTH